MAVAVAITAAKSGIPRRCVTATIVFALAHCVLLGEKNCCEPYKPVGSRLAIVTFAYGSAFVELGDALGLALLTAVAVAGALALALPLGLGLGLAGAAVGLAGADGADGADGAAASTGAGAGAATCAGGFDVVETAGFVDVPPLAGAPTDARADGLTGGAG